MSPEEILSKVQEVVARTLRVKADVVTPDARFVEKLAADSLDMVELTIALEDEFDIEISDDQAETWKSVQDAVKTVTEIIA